MHARQAEVLMSLRSTAQDRLWRHVYYGLRRRGGTLQHLERSLGGSGALPHRRGAAASTHRGGNGQGGVDLPLRMRRVVRRTLRLGGGRVRLTSTSRGAETGSRFRPPATCGRRLAGVGALGQGEEVLAPSSALELPLGLVSERDPWFIGLLRQAQSSVIVVRLLSNSWTDRAEEHAKLQTARRNMGIYEVSTDDKDYFKVIAHTRLKLEKDIATAMPCIEKNASRGKPRTCTTTPTDASEEQSETENTGACGRVKRKHVDHIPGKGLVGSFHNGLVHKTVSNDTSQSRGGSKMSQN